VSRDAGVGEFDFSLDDRLALHAGDVADELQAVDRPRVGDADHRHLVVVPVALGPDHGQNQVGHRAVGTPHLVAVEHEVVAVPGRPRLDRRGVATGLGLG
jgi:hypothetical protein